MTITWLTHFSIFFMGEHLDIECADGQTLPYLGYVSVNLATCGLSSTDVIQHHNDLSEITPFLAAVPTDTSIYDWRVREKGKN